MYARLWWKDLRQFWAIWLVLIVAAALTQWMLLAFIGRPARFGGLGISALLWASLYALTVGAGAFAGERETGTLKLLDYLPVNRSVIWAGKVSFALVTSLALTFLLLVMAAVSTEQWNPPHFLTPDVAFYLCLIVPVSLGWGLFWSSVTKTALGACLAGLTCVGLSLMIAGRRIEPVFSGYPFEGALWLAALAVMILTFASSRAFFAGGFRLKRLSVQLRSPIVLERTHAPATRRISVQSPVAATPSVQQPRPIGIVRPQEAGAAHLSRRSSIIAVRTLVIQTIKEAWHTWLLLAAVALAYALWTDLFHAPFFDSFWSGLLAAVGLLVGGVSVFGLENRTRTYRFLVHHGVRPGLVWAAKLTTWICYLALIALVAASTWMLMRDSTSPPNERIGLAVLSPPLVFAIAVICGMTCRRGITAFVMAMVISIGLILPLVSLVHLSLASEYALFFVTVGLLSVSWAWRADWMLDRPAPGRWLRLGLFVSIAFALLSLCHIGFRVWSVPDVGPIAQPVSWLNAASILASPDRNAAPLYEEAGRNLVQRSDPDEFLRENQKSLELIRRAAARPDCRFEGSGKPAPITPATRPLLVQLERLVSLEAQDRLRKGDLARSWDDILALFRMARHFSEGSGLEPALTALKTLERNGLKLAKVWAVARGQTPERLQSALRAYRELPMMPDPSEIMRAEANIVENTLSLSTSMFRDWLIQTLSEGQQPQGAGQLYAYASTSMIAAPWERARARRLNRVISAMELEYAAHEPAERREGTAPQIHSRHIARTLENTLRLMRNLFGNAGEFMDANDHNLVHRRALELILALRSWQFKHGGRLPDELDALVPEELPALPKDPYANRSFSYARWEDYNFPSVQVVLENEYSRGSSPPPGSRVLFSFGPALHLAPESSTKPMYGTPTNPIGFLIPGSDDAVHGGKESKTPENPKAEAAPAPPK